MKIRREPPLWVPGFFSPGESLGSSFAFFFGFLGLRKELEGLQFFGLD
jgi:hypothetical protein